MNCVQVIGHFFPMFEIEKSTFKPLRYKCILQNKIRLNKPRSKEDYDLAPLSLFTKKSRSIQEYSTLNQDLRYSS